MSTTTRRLGLAVLLVASVACRRGESEPPAGAEEPVFDEPKQHEDDGPLLLSEWSGGVTRGIVVRAPKTNEPPLDSTLTVQLWGGRIEDGSKILKSTDIKITGPSPWAFELALPEDEFDPQAGYGLGAMLNDPEGNIWFSSKPVAIFRAGEAQGNVEIVLDPMDSRAVAEE